MKHVNPICDAEGHLSPAANPRSDSCLRCGLPLPSTGRDHDPIQASQWTLDACDLVSDVGNPEGVARWLNRFAESRILPGPWREFYTRDWVVEGLEEIADNRNYAVTEMLRLEDEREQRADDEEYGVERMALQYVLATTIMAADAWHRYQELRSRR